MAALVVFATPPAEWDEFHEPPRTAGSAGNFLLLEVMFEIGGETGVFTSFCKQELDAIPHTYNLNTSLQKITINYTTSTTIFSGVTSDH